MNKSILKTLAAAFTLLAVLILSACSGLVGADGLYIYADGIGDARYIDGSADAGYVVVMKENKIYSLGTIFEDKVDFENGYVQVKGLPTGQYIVGVVLVDDDPDTDEVDGDVVGLAIKEVEIKKGPNFKTINVGPGLDTLEIGGLGPIEEDLFLPDDFGVSFAEDTIFISGSDGNPANINLIYQAGSTPGTVVTFANGRTFPVTDPDGGTHQLSIILE